MALPSALPPTPSFWCVCLATARVIEPRRCYREEADISTSGQRGVEVQQIQTC